MTFIVENVTPSLTDCSPGFVNVGSAATTITLTGSGFLSGAQVEWNGSPLPTTFVSATSLTVAVPAGDLSAAATIAITVVNPGPGGPTSSTVNFGVDGIYTYTYIGNYFDHFGMYGTNSLSTYDRITLTITFPQPLPDDGVVTAGVSGFPEPTSYTFTDGVHTITEADATVDDFSFTTSGGAITEWYCQAWDGEYEDNDEMLITQNPVVAYYPNEDPTAGDGSVYWSNIGQPPATAPGQYAYSPSSSWSSVVTTTPGIRPRPTARGRGGARR